MTLRASSVGGNATFSTLTVTTLNGTTITASSRIRTTPTTVAGLPSAATAGAGARAFVTDASAPTFGTTVTGGGAVQVPVYSDGSGWLVG